MGLCIYDSISVKTFCKLLPACSATALVFVLLFLGSGHAYALDVKLQWDASSDADHYVVYWRTGLQNYDVSRSQNVGSSITYDFSAPDDTYYFAVKAIGEGGLESPYSREVCALGPNDLEAGYDRGWGITSGDLAGFKVMYDSNDPTPTLGPSNALPPIPSVNAVGVPLNLQPSPLPPFATPVKIFIPCPGWSDVIELDIYYYDGANWLLANAADAPDIVQPGAVGWMEPGSREDINSSIPPTIAIRVVHFSGVQAGTPSPPPGSGPDGHAGKEGSGGGCFIGTAASP